MARDMPAGVGGVAQEVAASLASPLPDPAQVHVARLANGLQVWIRRHPYPPGHVAVGLEVRVGSLAEEEDQRGYAHFLEHLAFAGTRRFSPADLAAFFASLGTVLGHHHNAATTHEYTRFTLSLPTAERAVVRRALALLADFASGLSFPGQELERQRAIILEEIRARLDDRARAQELLLAALAPGSRLSQRHPLGTRAAVRAATAARLQAFYRRWYRPDLALLAVTGTVEPEEIVQLVAEAFAGWRAEGDAPSPPTNGVAASTDLAAVAVRSRELTHLQASHRVVRSESPPESEADLARRWALQVAWWALNRRLSHRLVSGRCPAEEARLSSSSLARGWAVHRAVAIAPRGRVEGLLRFLEGELEGCRRWGFSADEVKLAGQALLAALRQGAEEYATRPAALVLIDLLESAPAGRPPLTPAQRLDLARRLLPSLGTDAVQQALLAALPAEAGLLAAVVPAQRGVATPRAGELLAAHAAALTAPPAPAVVPAPSPWSLSATPVGVVVQRRHHPAPAVTTAVLGNGVVVHLAEMRQRPGRVFLTLTLAGGRIREQPGCLGITQAALLVARFPAAAGVPFPLLRDALVGRAVGLAAHAEEDCVTVQASTRVEDLETTLVCLATLLAGARLERGVLGTWRVGVRRRESQLADDLEVQLGNAAAALLSGGDPRFRLLTYADARALTWRAVQAWLEEEVCGAPLEAALVGDLAPHRAEALAAHYLGSLPPRPERRAALEALRQLTPAPLPATARVRVNRAGERAALLVGWQASPWRERRARHHLRVAEIILAERLQRELRERRGLTYSVECSYSPSKAYPALSLLAVACLLPPDRLGEAEEAIHTVVAELAADGPRPAELAAARTWLSRAARQAAEDPRHFSRLLAEVEYRGVEITQLGRLEEDYLNLDAATVGAALRATCTDARRLTVTAAPPPS